MKRISAMLIISLLLAMGMAFMQNFTPASSSPMLAITLTPTDRPSTPPPADPSKPKLPGTGMGQYAPAGVAKSSLVDLTNQSAVADPLKRLVIPSLEVSSEVMPIFLKGNEWDISQLGLKTGWLESVAHPMENSNTVLVAHLNLIGYGPGPFQKLSRLVPGATVQLYTENYIYTYQVRSQRIVEETDLSVVDRTSTPQLTMITCTQWDVNRQEYVKRLVTTADLVSKQLINAPTIRLKKYMFYAE